MLRKSSISFASLRKRETLRTLLTEVCNLNLVLNPLPSAFLLLIAVLSMTFLQINEEHLATILSLTSVSIFLWWRNRNEEKLLNMKSQRMHVDLQLNQAFCTFVLTPDLFRGPNFIMSRWITNLMERVWPKYFLRGVQSELDRNQDQEDSGLLLGENCTLHFEKVHVDEESLPIFKTLTPQKSYREDHITLKVRADFAESVELREMRRDRKVTFKELHFRGTLKATFRPLMKEYPFFAGISAQLSSLPVMDSSLDRKLLTEHNVHSEELDKAYKFILANASQAFVPPNEITVTFTEDRDLAREAIFPSAIFMLCIYVVEAEFMSINKESVVHYLCKIQTTKNILNTELKCKGKNPLFNIANFTVMSDWKDQCIIQFFNRTTTANSEVYTDSLLGEVRWDTNDSLFELGDQENESRVAELWVPLTKTQTGNIHLRFGLFTLSDNFQNMYNTQNSSQNVDEFSVKFPNMIFSIFVENFEPNMDVKEKKGKFKESSKVRVRVTFEKTQKVTKYVREINNIYTWNKGFHFLCYTFTPDEMITLETFEQKGNRKVHPLGTTRFLLKEVCEKENLCLSGQMVSSLEEDMGKNRSVIREMGKIRFHAAVKVVKAGPRTVSQFCQSIKQDHNLLWDSLNTNVPEMASPKGREKPVTTEKKAEAIIHKLQEECSVKMRIKYLSKASFCAHVICAKNVPVFDMGENPNPGIIVELWKMGHNGTSVRTMQKTTGFRKKTRDPFYGRKLNFTIEDPAANKYFIRILLATQMGFFFKRTYLLAELFEPLPPHDTPVEKQWYKLNVLGCLQLLNK